jgi:hypothetical protein
MLFFKEMKNLLKGILLLLFLGIRSQGAFAQVSISESIILTGDSAHNKQVKNVSAPVTLTQAVPVATIQKNTIQYNNVTGSNALDILLPINPGLYAPGLSIYFKAAAPNSGPVTLNVNGLGPIPIKKNLNEDLVADDLRAGAIKMVIFDGTNFQLINSATNQCPSGFTEVNKKYCIETDERTADTYFNAANTCFNLNARLCTWGEWYYACQKTSLALSNMTNNFEWCDSSTNESGFVRVNGSGTCTTIGQGGASTNNFPFRCCFSK